MSRFPAFGSITYMCDCCFQEQIEVLRDDVEDQKDWPGIAEARTLRNARLEGWTFSYKDTCPECNRRLADL